MKEKNIIHYLKMRLILFFHRFIFVFIILICSFLLPKNTIAQVSEYDVKAIFLMKITQYIEWPHIDTIDESKPFVIAVLGDNPFGTVLDDVFLSGERKIKNRKVKVYYFDEIEKIDNCNILFISRSEENKLNEILSSIKDKPILSVGDAKNFGEKGVHINFYLVKNKTKFELNESSVDAAGFGVDFHLRNIAKIIDPVKGGKK